MLRKGRNTPPWGRSTGYRVTNKSKVEEKQIICYPCIGKEGDKKKICTCENKRWEDKETIENDHLRWEEMRNRMETCHQDLILD